MKDQTEYNYFYCHHFFQFFFVSFVYLFFGKIKLILIAVININFFSLHKWEHLKNMLIPANVRV